MRQMSPLTVRRAGPQDADSVRTVVQAAYAKWVPVLGRKPVPMVADYDRGVLDHEIDLLHDDTVMVALIECIPQHDQLFIENIAVAPAHQGRGLGRWLLDHAERRAKAAALPKLGLLTAEAMASNVRLYQSAGFQIDGTSPFMGGTTIHMSKWIAPAPGT